MNEKIAKAVAAAILHDLQGRRGLRQEWDAIDADVQKEILAAWAALVLQVGLGL
jgi:hypothetical protein